MDDTGCDKVTEVIGLEVETRGKGVFLVLANLDACRILRVGMRIDAGIALRDNHRRMDVTVGALGQCHLLDELVHQGIEFRVFSDGIDRGTCFQPFIHIAVVEGRTVVLAFHRTCGHLEVAESVTAVQSHGINGLPRRVPSVPHRPNARG